MKIFVFNIYLQQEMKSFLTENFEGYLDQNLLDFEMQYRLVTMMHLQKENQKKDHQKGPLRKFMCSVIN